MKNLKCAAILFVSLFSITTMAQDVKITELKNPTIKAFITALDGSEAAAEKAVATYCSKSVIADGMIPTGKVTTVISEDGNCVRFQTLWIIDEEDPEEEAEPMVYDVCEEGGKIVSFDLDFGSDDEDEE